MPLPTPTCTMVPPYTRMGSVMSTRFSVLWDTLIHVPHPIAKTHAPAHPHLHNGAPGGQHGVGDEHQVVGGHALGQLVEVGGGLDAIRTNIMLLDKSRRGERGPHGHRVQAGRAVSPEACCTTGPPWLREKGLWLSIDFTMYSGYTHCISYQSLAISPFPAAKVATVHRIVQRASHAGLCASVDLAPFCFPDVRPRYTVTYTHDWRFVPPLPTSSVLGSRT